MKKTAGFTILEVMVTLTIAAIVAAIAAPSFSWLIRDTRFTTEANNIVAAFNLARSEAAKRGGVARVDSGTCTLLNETVDPVGYQLSANGNQHTLEYLGPYTTLGSSLTVGVPNSDKRYLYRVTGRGVFGSGGTRFVQSVFATME